MSKKKKILIFVLLLIAIVVVISFLSIRKINGKFEYSLPAKDDKFGVSVDSPILIRKVEMVQYYKNDDGTVELVFSNYHLDSFDEYINPEFPEDIQSEVFCSEDLRFSSYNVSIDVAKAIAYNDSIKKLEAKDFQLEQDITEFGLVYADGALVSASNNWEVGEIKITYSFIDPSNEYVLISSVKNNTIVYNPFFNISSK